MTQYTPTRIRFTHDIEPWTYRDICDYVLDTLNLSWVGREGRIVRRCVQDAYREFPSLHEWSHFRSSGYIDIIAPQESGTIAYTQSTRIVTLTGATFPASVTGWAIRVGDKTHLIDQRTDSTHVTLCESDNFGEDIAAGTTYTLFQQEYPLPQDFRRGGQILKVGDFIAPVEVNNDDAMYERSFTSDPTESPSTYTFMSSKVWLGRLVIVFSAPHSSARRYELAYERAPIPLRVFGKAEVEYFAGSVSGTEAELEITGTDTSFNSTHLGCVIRLPVDGTTDRPTGLNGGPSGDNPYEFQAIITEVTDETTLVIDRALPRDWSDSQYTIGSPIDVDSGSMFNAFLRSCERFYSLGAARDKDKLIPYDKNFRESLAIAKAADNRQSSLSRLERVGIVATIGEDV